MLAWDILSLGSLQARLAVAKHNVLNWLTSLPKVLPKALPCSYLMNLPPDLHFHDINKLLHSFDALIKNGHSLVVIEHNAEIIKCADWIIDLGPEGGNKGGTVVFEGTPEDITDCKASYTGSFLKKHFS